MKIHILTAFIFLFTTTFVSAQNDGTPEPYASKRFVIVQSTKSYADAKTTAIKASKQLNIKLDLRGLVPNKKTGLTDTKANCEEGGIGEYPCYYSRGRYDDGQYVSIEWSGAFPEFAKGYYIVIVASGDEDARTVLPKAKKIFKDAYAKKAKVYLGCMH
jgi:hypothetical protein